MKTRLKHLLLYSLTASGVGVLAVATAAAVGQAAGPAGAPATAPATMPVVDQHARRSRTRTQAFPDRHGRGPSRELLRRGTRARQGELRRRDAGELHEARAGAPRRRHLAVRAARRPGEVVPRTTGSPSTATPSSGTPRPTTGSSTAATRHRHQASEGPHHHARRPLQGKGPELGRRQRSDQRRRQRRHGRTENLRNSQWLQTLGPEFLTLAFKFAHEADPDAKLYYNDYNIETGPKHASSMVLLKRLITDGAPIHGVGIQGHWNTASVPYAAVDKAIADYASLGPEGEHLGTGRDDPRRAPAGSSAPAVSAAAAAAPARPLDPVRARRPRQPAARRRTRHPGPSPEAAGSGAAAGRSPPTAAGEAGPPPPGADRAGVQQRGSAICSWRSPPVRTKLMGLPWRSVRTWIFVLNPPRLRPSAWGPPFYGPPQHVGGPE